jgi:hypothetical protein
MVFWQAVGQVYCYIDNVESRIVSVYTAIPGAKQMAVSMTAIASTCSHGFCYDPTISTIHVPQDRE